jgi:hypothetical protein
MNYGEVLSKAWKIIWKFKVLWIFGILAALGSGGGGNGGGRGNVSYSANNNNNFFNHNFSGQVGAWLANNWWVFVVAAVLIFLLIIVIIVLSTYGRIGLTRGGWEADEGAAKLTFAGLFAECGRYFWRIILLDLLIFLVTVVAGLVIAAGTLGVGVMTLGIGLVCLIPFFCLLVIAGWLVEIFVRLSVISIVGEDVGITEGLRRGWAIIQGHLAESIVMGLVLGIGSGILRFFIALPFLLAAVPLIPAFLSQTQQAFERGAIGAVIVICVWLPFAIFLSGVVESYVGTSWTLTYRRLTGRTATAVEVV